MEHCLFLADPRLQDFCLTELYYAKKSDNSDAYKRLQHVLHYTAVARSGVVSVDCFGLNHRNTARNAAQQSPDPPESVSR